MREIRTISSTTDATTTTTTITTTTSGKVVITLFIYVLTQKHQGHLQKKHKYKRITNRQKQNSKARSKKRKEEKQALQQISIKSQA